MFLRRIARSRHGTIDECPFISGLPFSFFICHLATFCKHHFSISSLYPCLLIMLFSCDRICVLCVHGRKPLSQRLEDPRSHSAFSCACLASEPLATNGKPQRLWRYQSSSGSLSVRQMTRRVDQLKLTDRLCSAQKDLHPEPVIQ
jgi:hypothetical protein